MKTLKFLVATALLSTLAIADVNLGSCKGCHGQNWEKVALGKSKVVRDMSQKDIATALKGYKLGTYGASMAGIMKGQVAKYSISDLEAVAKKIAVK